MLAPTRRAFIGLGSNLGDRRAALAQALDLLRVPGLQLRRASSVYETAPQGPVRDQPLFYNAVVEVDTAWEPHALLRQCLAVERRMGRERTQPKGPRLIDLDLLLMEDRRIDSAELTVPHPELTHRAFALVPLLELAPISVDPRDGVLLCRYAEPLLRSQAIVRLGSIPGYPARSRLPAQHYPPPSPADDSTLSTRAA